MNVNMPISPAEIKRMRALRAGNAVGNIGDQYVTNETYLILKTALVNNNRSYVFNFFPDASTQRPGEIRLLRNDACVITGLGLFINKYSTASASNNLVGNSQLYSYPDPEFFVGNPASGADEYDCLEAVFHSGLVLRTQSNDRTTNLPTEQFRQVPQRLYDATGVQPAQWSLEDFIVDIEPFPVLNGQDDNYFNMTLPSNADLGVLAGGINGSAAAVTTANELTLIVRCNLYIGASAVALRNGAING